MSDDDLGWVYTEINPYLLDQMLDKNCYLLDRYDKMIAWHKAQRDYYATRFTLAEARAIMRWEGPVGKAKSAALVDPNVIQTRIDLDIATAQLGVCERRAHSLEKEAVILSVRGKLLSQSYNAGGGSY